MLCEVHEFFNWAMVLVVVSSFIWAMILANVFYCLFYLNLQGNWVVPIVQFLSSFSFTQSTQIGGDMCRSPTRDGVLAVILVCVRGHVQNNIAGAGVFLQNCM